MSSFPKPWQSLILGAGCCFAAGRASAEDHIVIMAFCAMYGGLYLIGSRMYGSTTPPANGQEQAEDGR